MLRNLLLIFGFWLANVYSKPLLHEKTSVIEPPIFNNKHTINFPDDDDGVFYTDSYSVYYDLGDSSTDVAHDYFLDVEPRKNDSTVIGYKCIPIYADPKKSTDDSQTDLSTTSISEILTNTEDQEPLQEAVKEPTRSSDLESPIFVESTTTTSLHSTFHSREYEYPLHEAINKGLETRSKTGDTLDDLYPFNQVYSANYDYQYPSFDTLSEAEKAKIIHDYPDLIHLM